MFFSGTVPDVPKGNPLGVYSEIPVEIFKEYRQGFFSRNFFCNYYISSLWCYLRHFNNNFLSNSFNALEGLFPGFLQDILEFFLGFFFFPRNKLWESMIKKTSEVILRPTIRRITEWISGRCLRILGNNSGRNLRISWTLAGAPEGINWSPIK